MARALSWSKTWKPRKPEVETDSETDHLAFKIAMAYKLLMKAKNPFGLPWDPRVKVRDTIHWPHFLKAARILAQIGGTPSEYVAAQWAGICKLARRRSDRVLFPQMLGTDNARMRYIAGREHTEQKIVRQVKKKHIVVENFVREDRRLEALRKHHPGVDDATILALHCLDFGRAYLQQKGVWEDVADTYERALSDD